MRDVADDGVDELGVAEAAVPAVVPDDEVHPHHRAREGSVQGEKPRMVDHEGAQDAEARREGGEVQGGVLEGLAEVRLEALGRDGRAELAEARDHAHLRRGGRAGR